MLHFKELNADFLHCNQIKNQNMHFNAEMLIKYPAAMVLYGSLRRSISSSRTHALLASVIPSL